MAKRSRAGRGLAGTEAFQEGVGLGRGGDPQPGGGDEKPEKSLRVAWWAEQGSNLWP